MCRLCANTAPFYIGNLSIWDFGICGESWKQFPTDMEGEMTVLPGFSQSVMTPYVGTLLCNNSFAVVFWKNHTNQDFLLGRGLRPFMWKP
jgi:hypothetical protein